MKKIKTLLLGAVALTAMSFTAANVAPVETAAMSLSETALENAVDLGYISENDKQQVIDSGIIEAMAQTLVDTNYDLAATVDRGAEIAVEKGWFRSKDAAKKALRKSIDHARNDQNAINKVYSLLGL